MRLFTPCILLGLITSLACDGGSPTGTGGPGPGPGPGDGSAATLDSVTVPGTGGTRSLNVMDFWTTNSGAYIPIVDIANPEQTTIVRMHGSEFSTNSIDEAALSIRPVDEHNEGSTEYSVYWVGSDAHWGMLNMNTGVTSFTFDDDDSGLSTVIPDRSPNAWEWGVDYQGEVLRKSATQTWEPLNLNTDLGNRPRGVSTPDGRLFVGGDSRFHVIGASDLMKTWDLASMFGSGNVNKVIAIGSSIWVGYGNDVLRIDPSSMSITRVATVANRPDNWLWSTFCVAGDLYLTDGRRINLTSGTSQSFITSDGTLSADEQLRAARITALLSAGPMDCINNNAVRPTLLIPSVTKIYRIGTI